MKKLLLAVVLFSCSAPIKVEESRINSDSLALVQQIDSVKAQFESALQDSAMLENGVELSERFKALQLRVMAGQLDKIELIGIKDELLNICEDKKVLYNKIKALKIQKDSIEKANVTIQKEVVRTKQLYNLSNTKIVIAENENKLLKNKYSKPTAAGVSIETFGFKKNLFTTKMYATNVAKDVKRIIVKFLIPKNENIQQKNYSFTLKIKEISENTTIVRLTGNELQIQPITIDISRLLLANDYPVTIECNGEVVYNSTLKLK